MLWRHRRSPKVIQGHSRSKYGKYLLWWLWRHRRSPNVIQGQSVENMYFDTCDVTENDLTSPKVIQCHSRSKYGKYVFLMRVTSQNMTKGHPRSSKVIQFQSMKNMYSKAFDVTEDDLSSSKVTEGQSMENMYFKAFDVTEDDPRSPKVSQGHPRSKYGKCPLWCMWLHRSWLKVIPSHPRSPTVEVWEMSIMMRVTSQKLTKGHPRSSKVKVNQGR